MLNHLRCTFDISYCEVIYYVIYVISSHYVSKAISPLFDWPSSYDYVHIALFCSAQYIENARISSLDNMFLNLCSKEQSTSEYLILENCPSM